jgi:Ca-activated chloride channel family protein
LKIKKNSEGFMDSFPRPHPKGVIKNTDMKNLCVSLIMLVTLLSFDQPQERTITGTITSAEDGAPIPGVAVLLKGTKTGTTTDVNGQYSISVPTSGAYLVFSFLGYQSQEIPVKEQTVINVQLQVETTQLSEVVVNGYAEHTRRDITGSVTTERKSKRGKGQHHASPAMQPDYTYSYHIAEANTEEYADISENNFHDVTKDPLSTFSIDVDKASYSNVRRFINNGQRPPVDAVRIEEMINYFTYDYAQPAGDDPFEVFTEVSDAPWNTKHKLVHIGLQGKNIATDNLPASNLVFLIDVSGSMQGANRLPLVKQSLAMLVDQLREKDHVAIVVYASATGVVLEPTSGANKKTIINALDMLEAGGSTAGGAGLKLAYALAHKHFKEGGNNRVILATDGDFNVGESSDEAMETLITEKRKEGIFLTVLGYGMGNYKDKKMEILADKGNGNYAYIDNLTEARKTLVSEFGGTLFTIAKDVKLQLEFNPAKVKAYRLIGYENRLLKSEDFNNDRKDAGELGSGHTVTALYEIIPVGVKSEFFDVDQLKYQSTDAPSGAKYTDELLTVKLRYKKPTEDTSKLIVRELRDRQVPLEKASANLRWSASVAAFGMLLRESQYVKDFTYDEVIQLAQSAKGRDDEGYRAEFINMAKSFGLISRR